MKWIPEAKVGGLITGISEKLLRMVGNKTVKDSFERLRGKLEKWGKISFS